MIYFRKFCLFSDRIPIIIGRYSMIYHIRVYTCVSSTSHLKQVKHCGGGGLSEKIDFGEIHRRVVYSVVAAAASPQTRLKREKLAWRHVEEYNR